MVVGSHRRITAQQRSKNRDGEIALPELASLLGCEAYAAVRPEPPDFTAFCCNLATTSRTRRDLVAHR